jgi:DNA polymerase III subunit gamma/tau
LDAASHTGVDKIRELKEISKLHPSSARFKIFIIDEAHMLSTGAFNALLKTLEEPPEHVVFILATTEAHKIPITVRSRCMLVSFKKVTTLNILKHLENILKAEKISYSEDAIDYLSQEAHGSIRDAMSLLEQAITLFQGQKLEYKSLKKQLSTFGEEYSFELFKAICMQETSKALKSIQEADDYCFELSNICSITAELFKKSLVMKSLGTKNHNDILALGYSKQDLKMIPELIKNCSEEALIEIFQTLSKASFELTRSTVQKSLLEISVIDCISKSRWLSSSELASYFTKQTSSLENKHNMTESKIDSKKKSPDREPIVLEETKRGFNDFDVNLFKKLHEALKSKNRILAARLKSLKFKEFHKNAIKIDHSSSSHLDFSLEDKKLIFSFLVSFGCSKENVDGFLSAEANSSPSQKKKQESLLSNKSINTISQEETDTQLRRFQSLANKAPSQGQSHIAPLKISKPSPKESSNSNITDKTESYSIQDLISVEEEQDFKTRKKTVINKKYIDILQKHASHIKIIDLKKKPIFQNTEAEADDE